MLLDQCLTEEAKVVWILSDRLLLIYSNSKKAKTIQISKGLTSHYLKNLLPSQFYGMQST